MPCYYPIDGWRAKKPNENGKYPVVFHHSEAQLDQWCTIGCGRCIGCRLERSRQWGLRCAHEATLRTDNCFITLTYDNQHLPYNGTLVKEHFSDFIKALRHSIYPERVRFFACGEYGENQDLNTLDTIGRPHYHAILFGVDLRIRTDQGNLDPNYIHQENNGNKIYTSPKIESLWKAGFSTIGNCTFQSAAYTARYCLKKIGGPTAKDHYRDRIPEFGTQSTKPGIGYAWFQKYRHDLDKGYVTVNGVKLPSAKYYNDLYRHHYGDEYTHLVEAKRTQIDELDLENKPARLRVKEEIKLKSVTQLIRNLH